MAGFLSRSLPDGFVHEPHLKFREALIKVSSGASRMDGLSVRDMVEALIAGERDPRVLAGLARGRMKAKHAELLESLNGRFDDHHGELARMLLDQIDSLTGHIDRLTTRIDDLITAMPAASGPGPGDPTGDGPTSAAGQRPDRPGDSGGLSMLQRRSPVWRSAVPRSSWPRSVWT